MIAVGFFQVQWSARCQATLLSLRKRLRLVDRPGFLTIRSRADADRASEGSQKELGAPLNQDARGNTGLAFST
jgi:hypothetical protein